MVDRVGEGAGGTVAGAQPGHGPLPGLRHSRIANPALLAMVAGLLWCIAVAVADVALGTRSIVFDLEVAGPMIAAAFAGARRTTIVAATAVGLSVVLGYIDHIFGTLDDIDRMGAVALGSVIAIWVAELRARREEAVAMARGAEARERQRRLALESSDSLHRLEASLALAEAPDVVTEATFAAVRDEMRATACVLVMLDETGTPTFTRATGLSRGIAPAGSVAAHGELPAGLALDRGGPLLVADLDRARAEEAHSSYGRLLGTLRAVDQKAACVLPLTSAGELVGAFVACWAEPREFSDEDSTWLQSVGAQYVAGMQRARLVALERGEAGRASQLAQLAASLSQAASAEEVAARALNIVASALGARSSSIRLRTTEPSRLRCVAAEGWGSNVNVIGDESLGVGDLIDDESGLVGSPVFVEDAGEARSRYPGLPGFHPAFAMLPFIASGDVLGALVISYGDPHRFEAPERRFLITVAGYTAQALERARLYDNERDARHRLALLGEATQLLSASLEPDTVCERLVDLVPKRLADLTAVLVPTRVGLRRTITRGMSSEGVRITRLLPRHQLIPYGADTPAMRAFETAAAQHGKATPEILEAAGLGSWLDEPTRVRLPAGLLVVAVPMLSAGSVLGVMIFARVSEEPRPFGSDDVSLASELASRAGLALENANRYQEEHQVSEILQRAVLPDSLPRLAGLTLDAEYRPGASGSFAGGDWYDALALGDGRVLLSVGDVMGKGPTAAALMGQVRSAIRAYAVEDGRPSSILSRLDRLFCEVGEERLVSVVVAVLDRVTGAVELSNAGHPPPLLVRPDGGTDVLEQGRSVIVGASGHSPARSDAHLVLSRGETLVFYSDGLIERRGEALSRGLDRLVETVSRESARWPTWHPGTAGAVADALLGNAPTDDVVVLTIHRVIDESPPGGMSDSSIEAELDLPAALDSPSAARRFVRGRLIHREGELAERAAMLVSEVVTNAVLHARSELRVVVTELPSGVVRVQVADQSQDPPDLQRFDPMSATGRGLLLVDSIADRWGHGPDQNARFAKVVWFEVGRDRPAKPASAWVDMA